MSTWLEYTCGAITPHLKHCSQGKRWMDGNLHRYGNIVSEIKSFAWISLQTFAWSPETSLQLLSENIREDNLNVCLPIPCDRGPRRENSYGYPIALGWKQFFHAERHKSAARLLSRTDFGHLFQAGTTRSLLTALFNTNIRRGFPSQPGFPRRVVIHSVWNNLILLRRKSASNWYQANFFFSV